MTKQEYDEQLEKLLTERARLNAEVEDLFRDSKQKVREIQTQAKKAREAIQQDMEKFISEEVDRREQERRALELKLTIIRHKVSDLKYRMYTIKNKDREEEVA